MAEPVLSILNDASILSYARHDSAEAISPLMSLRRAEGDEAILEIATRFSGVRNGKKVILGPEEIPLSKFS